jgi:hypothetical protein
LQDPRVSGRQAKDSHFARLERANYRFWRAITPFTKSTLKCLQRAAKAISRTQLNGRFGADCVEKPLNSSLAEKWLRRRVCLIPS